MPFTQPNLTIALAEISGCSGLSLTDTTPDYGDSGAPSLSDVETVTAKLTYNTLGSYIEYTFETSSGTITSALLSIQGGTGTDITSSLPSLVWPFTDFDLTDGYGVSLPTFADDVFTVDYTISGTGFDYTTTRSKMIACNSKCCLNKKWVAIDPNCECSAESTRNIMYGQSLYYKADVCAELGDVIGAVTALNSLKLFCGDDCGGCGC